MSLDGQLHRILSDFVAETDDIAAQITQALLRLERAEPAADATRDDHRVVSRGLHNLKGTAATLGLEALSMLAHLAEDATTPPRDAVEPLPPEVIDAVLAALGAFRQGIEAELEGRPSGPVVSEAAEALERLAGGTAPVASPGAMAPASPPERPAPAPEERSDVGSWRVDAARMTELIAWVAKARELSHRMAERARSVQLAGGEALGRDRAGDARELERRIAQDASDANTLVDGIEECVRAMCTVPVRDITAPLAQAVREQARATRKRVGLAVLGDDVALDRRTVEALRSPLAHLVRNAIDHGIEPPAVRTAAGKHEEGALVVRIEQHGNLATLEVSDDGGGIDADSIRRAAEASGLATGEALEAMTREQVAELIFTPGFTTRSDVSATSGRGVGLDAVRRSVEALGGRVSLSSVPGQGSRFVLSVPVELGSSPCMLVRAGDQVMGLPMSCTEIVLEASRAAVVVGAESMHRVDGDRAVPVADLAALLDLRAPEPPAAGATLVGATAQGRRRYLIVEEVMGNAELVVRPLPFELRRLPAYLGTAVTSHGELVLVLRPEWLVAGTAGPVRKSRAARRVLVVDDSPTARAMHRTLLEAAGFVAHAVGNAERALTQLAVAPYDVLVADVRMAGMDGFALTRAVRASSQLRDLPIVLVSAHDGADVAERAAAAGADAFLRKNDYASGGLLDAVSKAVAARASATS